LLQFDKKNIDSYDVVGGKKVGWLNFRGLSKGSRDWEIKSKIEIMKN